MAFTGSFAHSRGLWLRRLNLPRRQESLPGGAASPVRGEGGEVPLLSTSAAEVKIARGRCCYEAPEVGATVVIIEACQSSLGREWIGWKVGPAQARESLGS